MFGISAREDRACGVGSATHFAVALRQAEAKWRDGAAATVALEGHESHSAASSGRHPAKGNGMGVIYAAAAESLAQDKLQIVLEYRARLREIKSPLALRPDAWAKCRRQAELILDDCIAALSAKSTSHHIEIVRYSRIVGGDRVAQGIGVAESIRAVEFLWEAMQVHVRAAVKRERKADRASVLLAITTTFRSSAVSRLYAGAVGYDAALAAVVGEIDGGGRVSSTVSEVPILSRREREVLAGVDKALSNTRIARELGIAPATVKRHLQNIYKKLGARSRVDALNKAGLRP